MTASYKKSVPPDNKPQVDTALRKCPLSLNTLRSSLYSQLKVNKQLMSITAPAFPVSSSARFLDMNQQQIHAALRWGDIIPRAEDIGENYPHYQWNLLPARPTDRPLASAAI